MRKYYHLITIFLVFVAFGSSAQFYNGLNMTFGKNRVQYEERFWFYYQMDKYNIYHYAGGEKIAEYTALTAHQTMKELQQEFDYYSTDKIYFIIYNKLSEFRQSNIGLREDDGSNTGGVTRISGSKIFLYFEGDYVKLNQQIRSGLAEIMINKMMFGDNWREVIKNSTLLSIPKWYINGIVSYATTPWNVEIDNRVRDGILSGRYEKFNRLSEKEATYAGHALWNYIAEVHGEKVIPNILYMARVSRNIESGFLFVLGISLNTLIEESILHYRVRYELDEEHTSDPSGDKIKIRSKRRWIYSDWRVNNEGTKGAYVRNRLGKYKIYMYDLEKNRKKKIYRQGYKLDRINDYSYPLIDWHPNGEILSFIVEKKSENFLKIYDLKKKKTFTRPIFQLDEVLDFAYSPDGKKLVLSGVKKGQSDIYVLTISSNTQEQLTNDIYDDLNPRFTSDSEIIFSSNRTDDTLRFGQEMKITKANDPAHDIFIYDLNKKENQLRRITNTAEDDEVQPAYFEDGQYIFLSDANGIRNRYLATLDSAIISIDTTINYNYTTNLQPISNYGRSILEQDVNSGSSDYSEMTFFDNKYHFYKGSLLNDIKNAKEEIEPSQYKQLIEESGEETNAVSETDGITYTTVNVFEDYSPSDESDDIIDVNNYRFEDEEPAKEPELKKKDRFIEITNKIREQNNKKDSVFLPQRRNYNLNFTAVDLTTAVDFDYATDLYQPFNGGPYQNPGTGALLKVGMEDLFEDYLVEGGGRFGLGGGSNEFFISLDNRASRLDKKYILQRQTLQNINDQVSAGTKSIIHQGRVILGYPINEVLGINTTLTYRNDRIVNLALNNQSLSSPNQTAHWGGFKTELVFDNTRDIMLNVKFGTRFKLFYEFYGQVGEESGDISIAGFDFRHYQELHRELSFAFRMAGSTSFGSRKLVYYMGAVDNWFTLTDRDRFDFDTPIAQDQGYYWQAIATNMRGFIQNARNGNSFAVANSELRWPVISYFARKPIKNEFFGNFMLTGFFDVGTAWTGPSPYSEENSFNTIEIDGNPITIRIDNKREPIIAAYGFGVRSKLFGYYLRFDYGWGIEDQIIRDPVIHLSMGLDF